MPVVRVLRVIEPMAKALYPAGMGLGMRGGRPRFGPTGGMSYAPKTAIATKPQTGSPTEWGHAIRTLPTHLGPERHAAAAAAGSRIFGGKMPAHEVLRGFHVQHGDYRSRVTRVASPGTGQLHVRGDIFHTPTGDRVGEFRRTFEQGADGPEVRHDLFEMHAAHRGSGYGTHFYTQMEDHYRKAGVKKITMRADLKVGPYVWAMHGFDFAGPVERRATMRDFDKFLTSKGAPAFKRKGVAAPGHFPQHPVHSWEVATHTHQGQRLGKEFLTRYGNSTSYSGRWPGYEASKTLDSKDEGYQVGAAYQRVHLARGRQAAKTFKKALPEHGDHEPMPGVEAMERTMEPWHEDEEGDASAHEVAQRIIDEHHQERVEKSLANPKGEVHSGAVMMLWPHLEDAKAIAWPDGLEPEELHVTLAYLGKAADITPEQRKRVLELAQEWSQRNPFAQYVTEVTAFRDGPPEKDTDPVVALISPTILTWARAELIDKLRGAGLQPDATFPDYKPHVTLAYIPRDGEIPQFDLAGVGLVLDRLVVTFGNEEHVFRLERPRTGVGLRETITDTVSPPGLLSGFPQVWKSEGAWHANVEWVKAFCEPATMVKAVRAVHPVSAVGEGGIVMHKPASPMPTNPRMPSQPNLRKPSHPTHPNAAAAGGEVKVPRLAGGHIDWSAVPEGMSVWVTIKNEASPLYGRAVRIQRRGGGFTFAGGSAVVKQQAMLAGTSPSKLMDELNREHAALGRMGMPKETLQRRERMLQPLAERGRLAPTEGLSPGDIHELARVHSPVFPGAKPPEQSEAHKRARAGATSVAGQAVRRTLSDPSRFIRREAKSIRANLARAAGMRVRDLKKRDLNALAQELVKEGAAGSRVFRRDVSPQERAGFMRALTVAIGSLSRERAEHVSTAATDAALNAMGHQTPEMLDRAFGIEAPAGTEAASPEGTGIVPEGTEVAHITKRQVISIIKNHTPDDITGMIDDIKAKMKANAETVRKVRAPRERPDVSDTGPMDGKPKVGVDPALEAQANALLESMKNKDGITVGLPPNDDENTPTHKVRNRLVKRFGRLVKNPKVRESIERIGVLAQERERIEGMKEEANRVISEMIKTGSAQSADMFVGTMADEFAAFQTAWKGDMEEVTKLRKQKTVDPKFMAQVAGALGGNTVSRKMDSVLAFNGVVDKYFNRQKPLWAKDNPYDVPEVTVGAGRRKRSMSPEDLSPDDLANLSDAGEGLKHLGPYYQNEMGALFNHVINGYFPDVPGMQMTDREGRYLVRRYGASTAAYLFAGHLWRQHVLVRPRSSAERARFRESIDAIKTERPGVSDNAAIREYVRRRVDTFKASREAIKNETMRMRPIVEQDIVKSEADLVKRRATIDHLVDETVKEYKAAQEKGDKVGMSTASKGLARLHADAAKAHIEGATKVGRALGALEGSALLYDAMGVMTSETRQRKHDMNIGMGADEEQARNVATELFGHDKDVVNTGTPENPQWWVSTTADSLMRTAGRRVQATRSHDEALWKERKKMFVPRGQKTDDDHIEVDDHPDVQDEKDGEWYRDSSRLLPDVASHMREGTRLKVGQANALDNLTKAKSAHLDHLYGMGKTIIVQGHNFNEIENAKRLGVPHRAVIVAQDPTPWTIGDSSSWSGVLDNKDIPVHYSTKVTGVGEAARTVYDAGAAKKFLANPHGVLVVSAADARRGDFQEALAGFDEDGETKVHHVTLDEPHRFLMNKNGRGEYGSVGKWLFTGKNAVVHPAVEPDPEKGVDGRAQGAHIIMATATPADATRPDTVHRIFQPIAKMRGRTMGTIGNFRTSMRGLGTQSGATEARRQQFIHDAVGDMQVSNPATRYPFEFDPYDIEYDLKPEQVKSMQYWQTDEGKTHIMRDIEATARGREMIDKGTPNKPGWRKLDPESRERWGLRLNTLVNEQVLARQRDAQYGVPTEQDPNNVNLEKFNAGAAQLRDRWMGRYNTWKTEAEEATKAGKEPPPPPKFVKFTWDSPHQATATYHMLNRMFPGQVVYAAHATCGDYHGRPRDKEGKGYAIPAHTAHPESVKGTRISAEQKARDARDLDIARWRKGVNKDGKPYIAIVVDSLSREAVNMPEVDDLALAGLPFSNAVYPGEPPSPDIQTFGQAIGRGTRTRQGRRYAVGFMRPKSNTEMAHWASADRQRAAGRAVMPAATSLFDELLNPKQMEKSLGKVWVRVTRPTRRGLTGVPLLTARTLRRDLVATAE